MAEVSKAGAPGRRLCDRLTAMVALAGLLAPSVMVANRPRRSSAKKTSTASKRTGSKKRSTRSRKKGTWRSRQMAPTPERYKEIQQALASKGYLQGSASGTWDQSSVDALRRFQRDQNLEPTGKLNALSLMALGLGPKRDSSITKPPVRTP